MKPEKIIVNKIIKLIKQRGGKVLKTTPPGVEDGTGDLLGAYSGRSLHFEVKKGPKETATKIQQHRCKEWKNAGAVSGVVDSPDQVEVILDALDLDPAWRFSNEEDWRFTSLQQLPLQRSSEHPSQAGSRPHLFSQRSDGT